MKEILFSAGYWLLIMALIGLALLLTKRIADYITASHQKTEQKQGKKPGGDFRNPYFVSEEEMAEYKRQTDAYNKGSASAEEEQKTE